MLTNDKKQHALLAKTGIFKAGYLFKRHENGWRPLLILLNDHTLTLCHTENKNVITSVLLTSHTKVYDEDVDIFRIETGMEVLVLKGQEMDEWKRAISTKVKMLSSLARGQFRVTYRGRSRDYVLMLHKECITAHHGSFQNAISRLYPFNFNEGSFADKGNYILIKGGSSHLHIKLYATTLIEHQHWVFALTRMQSGTSSPTVPSPPLLPLHSGTLEFFDLVTMKWKNKYVVLSDTCCLYTHNHRKVGKPRQYALTPSMIYETNLANSEGRYSFQLVFFSETLHLAAPTKLERDKWMSMLKDLISSKSVYDKTDVLQSAALEKDVECATVSFESVLSPGICLQARGNWMAAAVVSEPLTSTVCPGSILSSIGGVSTTLTGIDSTAKRLTLSKGPLRLTFWNSPRKMGWVNLVSTQRYGSRWFLRRSWSE